MASRMLHYIIAEEVMKRMEITDKNRFIIGSLLPDASSHQDESYDKAHYQDRMLDGTKKGINWNIFCEKYEDKLLDDSLYLGYLCHLITDAIWFKRMTDKYIRIYPKKDRIRYIKEGYRDFQRLNSILVNEYKLGCPSLQSVEISMKEIDIDMVESILLEFANDFNSIERYHREELTLYPYEDVKQFIVESVEVCYNQITAIRDNKEKINPTIYYTEVRNTE